MRTLFGPVIGRFRINSPGVLLALFVISTVTVGCGLVGQGSCAQEVPRLKPSRAAPGETFDFYAGRLGGPCEEDPAGSVRVELHQGDEKWILGTLEADFSRDFSFDEQLTVPDDAGAGPATVVVHMDRGATIEVPFRVLRKDTASQDQSPSAAFAQPRGESPVNPPDFVLERDGTIVVDGDVVTNCRSFIVGLRQGGYDAGKDQREQARKVKERCEQLGLSSGGDFDTHDSKIVLELEGQDSSYRE